jgi:hypothetical protein
MTDENEPYVIDDSDTWVVAVTFAAQRGNIDA